MFNGYHVSDELNEHFSNEVIDVLDEDEPNVVTYSRSTSMSLYSYKDSSYGSLMIPYKTIKHTKIARQSGIREIIYDVFHRPDQSPKLRSMLDLWGFDNYHNYLYTICELGFLEGLIPVVDFGFLMPNELEFLYDIVAIFKTPLFTDYDCVMAVDNIRTLERSFDIRSKVLKWSCQLGYPSSTGIYIHDDLDLSQIKNYLNLVKEYCDNYGHVYDFIIQTHSRYSVLNHKQVSKSK